MKAKKGQDSIIIGAGAAGLMCAATAAKRGLSVLVLDHNEAAAKKVLVSGGGRANFTNRVVSSSDYVSENPHFAKSALARFGPEDFCAFLKRRGVSFVEEEEGKLFCRGSSKDLAEALLAECREAGARIKLGAAVEGVEKGENFVVSLADGETEAKSVVVATGGVSWKKLGASDLGYRIAKRFGLDVIAPRPALVPLTWSAAFRNKFGALSGISVKAEVSCAGKKFNGGVLFTHRGLSGPAILDASTHWRAGGKIVVNLFPDEAALEFLREQREARPKAELKNVLATKIPKRLAEALCESFMPSKPLSALSQREIGRFAEAISGWEILPAGTGGFDAAEVTAGGVSTAGLSSKTMEARAVPGLFFAGEVIDVTGRLGGFNLHWAWASGYAAGTHL